LLKWYFQLTNIEHLHANQLSDNVFTAVNVCVLLSFCNQTLNSCRLYWVSSSKFQQQCST